MKLIYLGEELDSSVEHELNYDESQHPYGWDVIVTYKTGIYPTSVNTHHNCTEVHNRYTSFPGDERIALESDIHGTGGTRALKDLVSVEITVAKLIADSH